MLLIYFSLIHDFVQCSDDPRKKCFYTDTHPNISNLQGLPLFEQAFQKWYNNPNKCFQSNYEARSSTDTLYEIDQNTNFRVKPNFYRDREDIEKEFIGNTKLQEQKSHEKIPFNIQDVINETVDQVYKKNGK